MVNKKIVIIATIIAIIVVGGIVYFSINRETREASTSNEQIVENEVENKVENNIEENTQIEENEIEENEIEENEVEENEIDEENDDNEISNTTSDSKNNEETLTGKEKALELVKKEWGENDDTVYYYVEEQVSDKEYIISVRDKSTTQDLSTYKVNVSSSSVEEY